MPSPPLPTLPVLELRDLLPFPAGDNATDTLINGVHFNLTALTHFNYTIYDNGTISNASKCYLIFDQYRPRMYDNGTWIYATSCYDPYYGIGTRGKLCVAFATFFGISIVFTLMNLRKHGRQFLREDKRFRLVGRRWTWYWMCFVAACGLTSCITGIDVDRSYLQSLGIVLQSFFYSLMLPGTLAMVWEATRHWGSWQERQIVDRDPYLLPQDDRRGRIEFFMPLVFYAFAWLHFFMVIPRGWGRLQNQRSPEQQASIAAPSATDIRLKVGSIFAWCAYLVICFSLHHSLKHYKPRASNVFTAISNFCRDCPAKIFLALAVLGIRLAYGNASVWEWNLSLLKYNGNPVWPFALGYGPTVLLIAIFEIAGWVEENEDRVLIEQRRTRHEQYDRDLGITKKPSWWSKFAGSSHMSDEQRLRNLTSEVGGGRATTDRITSNVELRNMSVSAGGAAPAQSSPYVTSTPSAYADFDNRYGDGHGASAVSGLRDRSRSRPRDDPFRDPSPASTNSGLREPMAKRPGMPGRSETDAASTMTGTTITEGGNPQRIRSMLDV